jgi:hypothetical protein
MSPQFNPSDESIERILNDLDKIENAGNVASNAAKEIREILNACMQSTPLTDYRQKTCEYASSPLNWMNQPATDRQLAILEQRDISIKPGLTKGEASSIINKLFREESSHAKASSSG